MGCATFWAIFSQTRFRVVTLTLISGYVDGALLPVKTSFTPAVSMAVMNIAKLE
jgi:hypothetical protein